MMKAAFHSIIIVFIFNFHYESIFHNEFNKLNLTHINKRNYTPVAEEHGVTRGKNISKPLLRFPY